MKRAQLLDAVFLVFRFLVFVFEAHRAPFQFEDPLHFLKRQLVALAQLAEEPLDRVVHDAAEAERRFRSFFQRPQISEQILLRAGPVSIHRRRAECQRLRRRRMKSLRPVGDPRENLRWPGRNCKEVPSP